MKERKRALGGGRKVETTGFVRNLNFRIDAETQEAIALIWAEAKKSNKDAKLSHVLRELLISMAAVIKESEGSSLPEEERRG